MIERVSMQDNNMSEALACVCMLTSQSYRQANIAGSRKASEVIAEVNCVGYKVMPHPVEYPCILVYEIYHGNDELSIRQVVLDLDNAESGTELVVYDPDDRVLKAPAGQDEMLAWDHYCDWESTFNQILEEHKYWDSEIDQVPPINVDVSDRYNAIRFKWQPGSMTRLRGTKQGISKTAWPVIFKGFNKYVDKELMPVRTMNAGHDTLRLKEAISLCKS